ncbi:type II toxin-antitoxin system VapC family toxin [Tundrisphaera sp. TA3]|uniref:type II toxin-antitoxin system VapC family toxin n=1 Tax=Tundrisphaera sp. TA3 TaxID=3435775 RepID=UPI003EBD7B42
MSAGLLLDTHALLWFFQDDRRLSATAKAWIEDPRHHKFVSIATCWEISIKVGLGKLDLGEPTRTFLDRALVRNRFSLLPISLVHATQVEFVANHHRDPFDRMLIAQATVESLPLVSADSAFDAYPIRRIW